MQDDLSQGQKLHHEDIELGTPYDNLGSKTVTKEEILAYGRAYDPQPIHVDEEAAKHTSVGGLCASGWHTCAMMMRMVADGLLNRVASLGAPGVDEGAGGAGAPRRHGHLPLHGAREAGPRVAAGRGHLQGAGRASQSEGRGGRQLAHQPNGRAGAIRAPHRTPPRRGSRASPSPACGMHRARPARRAPTSSSRTPARRATDLGTHTFGRDEIIAFARESIRSRSTLTRQRRRPRCSGAVCVGLAYGGLCHPRQHPHAAAGNEAARAEGIRLAAYGPSPGFRNLTWMKPAYVGDTLEYRGRLAQKIDLKSRPDRGIVATDIQARNQKGEIVFSVISQILAERREPYRPA